MKKYNIRIYRIKNYCEPYKDAYRSYGVPKYLKKFWDKSIKFPPFFAKEIFLYKYIQLHPSQHKNCELEILQQRNKKRIDVEYAGDMWCSSQRFKDFCEAEDIKLNFFPVLVEGERRYLTNWRSLPVLGDYEVDIKKSVYENSGNLDDSKAVFRSDFIEYYKYKMFATPGYSYMYITGELKQKLDDNNFLFNFYEKSVTQKKLNKKKIIKDLEYARKRERELYLKEIRKPKFQERDDYLEKVLVEEGNKEILEKFRKEMKGIWKKDFERYEKGLMEPLERITYW